MNPTVLRSFLCVNSNHRHDCLVLNPLDLKTNKLVGTPNVVEDSKFEGPIGLHEIRPLHPIYSGGILLAPRVSVSAARRARIMSYLCVAAQPAHRQDYYEYENQSSHSTGLTSAHQPRPATR